MLSQGHDGRFQSPGSFVDGGKKVNLFVCRQGSLVRQNVTLVFPLVTWPPNWFQGILRVQVLVRSQVRGAGGWWLWVAVYSVIGNQSAASPRHAVGGYLGGRSIRPRSFLCYLIRGSPCGALRPTSGMPEVVGMSSQWPRQIFVPAAAGVQFP